MTNLSIVIPCYNEEQVLSEACLRLLVFMEKMIKKGKVSSESQVYLIDDGSEDCTWDLIENEREKNEHIRGIKLSRNFGHQNALLAGLHTAEGDAIVTVDADLQDDIGVIEEMIDKFQAGCDVVYGVRNQRDVDNAGKKRSAELYYKLLNVLGVNVVFNHADFRLLSRRALETLKNYNEVNIFLRGMVPTLGFPSAMVEYKREKRFAGVTKYPVRKMAALAWDGVSSFSSLPLRMIALLGLVIFLFSMALAGWVLWTKLISGDAAPGWASSVLPIYFLGGLQLFCIGVVGEYIGKVYMEVKKRPRFIIEKIT